MQSQPKPFVLVDGSSYLFRAYHALPPLTNAAGEPSGAIYGVVNMLRRLLSDYRSEHIAIVFDAKGKTFRHQLYPEYKANRPPMPEELALQIKPLHDIVRAMGFPLVMEEGVEADDVIGTLARQAEQHGLKTVISTGDKDMAQLVTENISLVNTMSDTTMDIAGVQEKFGVGPERIIDYLALMGDTVDNVPGVPKVGPKTAVKLLNEYGSLQGVIEHADAVKGKLGENLRNAIATLPLSKTLVTIKEDVALDCHPEDLRMGKPDNKILFDLFKRFEFKRWLAELTDEAPVEAPTTQYETVLTEPAFNAWLQRLEKADCFAFDTETTSLNYMDAEIVGVSFADKAGSAAYVPVAHQGLDAPEQLDRDFVLNALKPLLESDKPKVIGQHIKYDLEVLANYGIKLNAVAYDTMLESYVMDSQGSRHDMDSLARNYLQKETISYEEVAGKGAKQIRFDEVAVDVASPYAAEDADITLQLHQFFWEKISADEKLKHVLLNLEMPLIDVLASIERHGVLIDLRRLKKQSIEIEKRLAELEAEIFDLSGGPFNVNSPKQLQVIFYEQLKLPILKKTPKGQPSTAEPVLQELALDYPLPKLILEYRSLSKLKSTYIDALPEQVNAKTGRVHTSYHQAVAATGRLSSSNPNLQNIPVRTEEGRRIRQAFVAPEGYKVLAADYSQIELRIMAHLSQDKGLLQAFADGLVA